MLRSRRVSFQIAGPPLWRKGKIYPSLIALEGTAGTRRVWGRVGVDRSEDIVACYGSSISTGKWLWREAFSQQQKAIKKVMEVILELVWY